MAVIRGRAQVERVVDVSGVVSLLIGTLILVADLPYPFSTLTMKFVGLILLLFGGSIFGMSYLQRGFWLARDSRPQKDFAQYWKEIDARLEESQRKTEGRLHELEYLRNKIVHDVASASVPTKEGAVESLREELRQGLGQEFIQKIRDEAEKAVRLDQRIREADPQVEAIKLRLGKEIERLNRTGNLNLIIGAFIALTGLGFLGWFVHGFGNQARPWEDLASFAPRLSLVLLIETFSFFFLSLYRWGLHQIKYFHNELTTVEARAIALRVAAASQDSQLLLHAIQAFAFIERNPDAGGPAKPGNEDR